MNDHLSRMRDIASRINDYLQKFEADPRVNKASGGRILPFYHAWAWHAGGYIGIRYVSFQGISYLTRQDAERYLAWLDQGGIGSHWKAGVD